MKDKQEFEKSKKYWYDQIMKYDGELASYEAFIDRLESQLTKLSHDTSSGIRAALSEARVLANAVRAKRDQAIDEFDVLCDVEESEGGAHD